MSYAAEVAALERSLREVLHPSLGGLAGRPVVGGSCLAVAAASWSDVFWFMFNLLLCCSCCSYLAVRLVTPQPALTLLIDLRLGVNPRQQVEALSVFL